MATNNNAIPAMAAAAAGEVKPDDKGVQKDGAVHEAAHAAAEIEADATVAAAAAEAEAKKLAKDAGEGVAQKWLEGKLNEIEEKANQRFEALKTWFDDRLKAIEGKKPEEKPTENPPAAAAPAPAAPPEEKKPEPPAKRKRRRI